MLEIWRDIYILWIKEPTARLFICYICQAYFINIEYQMFSYFASAVNELKKKSLQIKLQAMQQTAQSLTKRVCCRANLQAPSQMLDEKCCMVQTSKVQAVTRGKAQYKQKSKMKMMRFFLKVTCTHQRDSACQIFLR